MAVVEVYPQGYTGGLGSAGNAAPEKRGECGFWSTGSARRFAQRLMSVDPAGLTGVGFALTLTVREEAPSVEAFKRARERLLDRLRRMGMVRCVWQVEAQLRGTPHVHAAVYFPAGAAADVGERVVQHWLVVAAELGAGRRGQDVQPIRDALAWSQYLAKHAARGARHAQREAWRLPPGWDRPGRVWGFAGDWPTRSVRFGLEPRAFFALRRVRRAQASAAHVVAGDFRSSRAARRAAKVSRRVGMTRDDQVVRSRVRGLTEWGGEAETFRLIAWLRRSGFYVVDLGPRRQDE